MPENFRALSNFFILQVVAMFLITLLLPRIKIKSIFGAVAVVLSLSLLNSTVWDSQLFHKLPDFQSSHGMALIIANGALFYVLVKILPGIEIKGIFPAFVAPIAYSIATILIQTYGGGFDMIQFGKSAGGYISTVRDRFQEESREPLSEPLDSKSLQLEDLNHHEDYNPN